MVAASLVAFLVERAINYPWQWGGLLTSLFGLYQTSPVWHYKQCLASWLNRAVLWFSPTKGNAP